MCIHINEVPGLIFEKIMLSSFFEVIVNLGRERDESDAFHGKVHVHEIFLLPLVFHLFTEELNQTVKEFSTIPEPVIELSNLTARSP